jgi:hypothetical protein
MSATAWQEGDRSVLAFRWDWATGWQEGGPSALAFRRDWVTAWQEADRSVLKAVVQQSASVSRRPTER